MASRQSSCQGVRREEHSSQTRHHEQPEEVWSKQTTNNSKAIFNWWYCFKFFPLFSVFVATTTTHSPNLKTTSATCLVITDLPIRSCMNICAIPYCCFVAQCPSKNKNRHVVCHDSTTPHYKPSTNLREMWVNTNQRPPVVLGRMYTVTVPCS